MPSPEANSAAILERCFLHSRLVKHPGSALQWHLSFAFARDLTTPQEEEETFSQRGLFVSEQKVSFPVPDLQKGRKCAHDHCRSGRKISTCNRSRSTNTLHLVLPGCGFQRRISTFCSRAFTFNEKSTFCLCGSPRPREDLGHPRSTRQDLPQVRYVLMLGGEGWRREEPA